MTDKPEAVPMTCSRPEAAAYLGISTRTFDRIQKSRVIAYVWVGRRRRYLLSDLQSTSNPTGPYDMDCLDMYFIDESFICISENNVQVSMTITGGLISLLLYFVLFCRHESPYVHSRRSR